jgi:hypothetical protein
MKKLILLGVLLVAGCSSPVLKLRAIGENQEDRQVSYATSDILDRANNAAFLGENETSMQIRGTACEVIPIAKSLKKTDRRFEVKIEPDSNFTNLIVRW